MVQEEGTVEEQVTLKAEEGEKDDFYDWLKEKRLESFYYDLVKFLCNSPRFVDFLQK